MYNYDIAVPEFFNILLKNSGRHYRQLLNDVHEGYISPDVINSILLSKNNKAFAREALPLELLELKAGYDDDEEYTPEELKNIQDKYTDLQLDEDQASAIKENNADSQSYDASHISPELITNAKNDHFNVTVDRILNGIQESDEIPEGDKVGAALAFLYNTALKKQNSNFAADYKLDASDLSSLIDTDSLRQRIVSDYIPITYKSDKDSFIDSDGNIKYKSLFAPNRESLAMFDLFANRFVNDIKANKEIPFNAIGKYIQNTYNDTLRTMSYTDWLDKLEDEWIAEQKKNKLGSAADYTDEEWADKAKSFELPSNKDLVADKELFTPEDWAEDTKYGFQDYVIPKPRKSQAKKGGRWQHTTTDEGDYEAYQNHLLSYIHSDKHAQDLARVKAMADKILTKHLEECMDELDYLDLNADPKDKSVAAYKDKLQYKINWYNKLVNPEYDNQDVRLTNFAEMLLRRKIQKLYNIRDRSEEFKKGYNLLSREARSEKYGNVHEARKEVKEKLDDYKQEQGLVDQLQKNFAEEDKAAKEYNDTEFSILEDELNDDEYKTLDNKVLKRKKSDEEAEWEEAEEKYADKENTVTMADWAKSQQDKAEQRTYENQKKAFELLDRVKSDKLL